MARDLGLLLGYKIELKELRREKSGAFELSKCVTLQQVADAYWLWKECDKPEAMMKIIHPVEKLLLDLPVFGPIAQKMAISRFCHVLDTLDRTGVPILEALEIAGKTAGNTFIEDRLSRVYKDVSMGKKVAVSINAHTIDIFPTHVLKMIQVGEEAGAMDDMLTEIGNMTDAEVQDKVLKLTATLEPIITVVMGVFILTLALSIFLPIWDMYEALSKG